MPIARVTDVIMETTTRIDLTELNLTNRKSKLITNVFGRLCGCSWTVAHYDAHKSDRTRTLGDSNRFIATASISDISMGEQLPVVIIIGVHVHRIVARPIFDSILLGVRRPPMDADGVHRFRRTQVDHYPLRMRVFGFTGEMWIEVRIAFPKRSFVAIGDTGIAVIVCLIDGVSASWQTIAIGEVDRFPERIVGRPVSAFVNRIAPRAARIPMPDFARELGAQPICQWPEPGCEHLGDALVCEHPGAFAFLLAVNSCAQ